MRKQKRCQGTPRRRHHPSQEIEEEDRRSVGRTKWSPRSPCPRAVSKMSYVSNFMFDETEDCSCFECSTGLEEASEVGPVLSTLTAPIPSPAPMEVDEEDKVAESGIMVNGVLIPAP